MASATIIPYCLKFPPSIPSIRISHGARLALFNNATFLKLSSSQNISGFRSILPNKLCITWTRQNPPSSTIVSAKGYKMKTPKASAKRFRVTGSGKIIRRRAGKQHLPAKKEYEEKIATVKIGGLF